MHDNKVFEFQINENFITLFRAIYSTWFFLFKHFTDCTEILHTIRCKACSITSCNTK